MDNIDRQKIDDDDGGPPPPDYATVIIETNRQTSLPRSETSYGRLVHFLI
jgi:hypothetical protein